MPRDCQRRNRLQGFSLLEIIVVTVLLAMLVALVTSQVSGVWEKQRAAVCSGNLRMLVNAGLMYAVDNGGYLPDRTRWARAFDPQRSILLYMGLPVRESGEPERRENSVLSCPSVQASSFRTNHEWHRTYSINQYATGGEYDAGTQTNTTEWVSHVQNRGVPGTTLAIMDPSIQAFFMDGTSVLENAEYRYSMFQAPNRLESAREGGHTGWLTPYIHGDGINVAFMDGHVEWISREFAERELVGPTNPSVSQAHTSPRTKPFWGTRQ